MHPCVLVTGGPGTVGREVVPLLVEAGQEVRVLSRHGGPSGTGVERVVGNTLHGSGLTAAFAGVGTVLHLAGGARGDDVAAGHVGAAARAAGVGHLVLISVTGADRMPLGYFRAKARAEDVVRASGVSWTVLRVAQLHDFLRPVVRVLAGVRLRVDPRGLRFEPVGVEDVARRLVDLTLGEPAGRVPDLAGPEVLTLAELLTAAGVGGPRLRVPLAGAAGRAYRAGENLAVDPVRGTLTWPEFFRGSRPAPRATSTDRSAQADEFGGGVGSTRRTHRPPPDPGGPL